MTLPVRGRSAHFLLLAPVIFAFAAVANGQAGDIMFSPFWDFYSENRLALAAGGRGYAGVAASGDISSTLLNPASLHSDSAWSFSLGYAYKSDLPWLKEIWHDVGEMNLTTLHPCLLVGVGHRFENSLQAGIVYYDQFSYQFDEGDIWYTGPNGEYLGSYHGRETVRVCMLSLPVAYRVAEAVTIGVSANIGYYRHDLYWRDWITSDFINIVPQIGFIVGPIRQLSLGLSCEPSTERRWNANGSLLNKFPARFNMGLCYTVPQMPLSLYLDFRQIWTAEIDRTLKNRQDVNFGLEYETPGQIFRAGFFTLHDYRIPQYYGSLTPAGDGNQYFLTGGITLKKLRLPATVNVMDSHILSHGDWKTTMVTIGFNIQR